MTDVVFSFFIVGIGIANIALGYRSSRLDHNPWADAPLGGLLSGPKPGLLAAHLDVPTINARGRRLMVTAPIFATLFLLFFLHTRHYF